MTIGAALPAGWTDAVRDHARIDGGRIAIVDPAAGVRLSYAALDRAADRWAAWLGVRGVRPGERVATLAGTRWEQFALLYACLRTGAVLVPLNWRLADAELAAVVSHARPALTLVEHRFADRLEGESFEAAAEAAAAAEAVAHGVGGEGASPGTGRATGRSTERRPAPAEPPREDAPVLLLYTSGSSGAPKGALIGRRQLFWNGVATCMAWRLGAGDVAPVSSPLFHTGGWNVFATPLLHCGGRVVLVDRFDPDTFLDVLASEGCTMALTVPTQLVMLQESAAWGRPLPALRRFLSGGAPLPPAVAERTRAAGYRLREGYGLTECGPNCFVIGGEEAVLRPGSVGRPVPFLEARVVRDGRDVPRGDAGELWLRGPQRFTGYLDAPALTAEAITPDGWLRTGDLARQGEAGEFYICGRLKEMYISGGENVFPAEVEAVLAGCPGVVEVAVVGTPDARWGEVGTAFVVARAGAPGGAELLAWARARLAGYKVPHSVCFVDALPRLGSGKADRRALIEAAAGRVTAVQPVR